jgi:hypothetical protein
VRRCGCDTSAGAIGCPVGLVAVLAGFAVFEAVVVAGQVVVADRTTDVRAGPRVVARWPAARL